MSEKRPYARGVKRNWQGAIFDFSAAALLPTPLRRSVIDMAEAIWLPRVAAAKRISGSENFRSLP